MEKFTNPLENVKIAAPCAADWNEMVGDERQRYCGACRLNVYNLSGMSQREAENLILQSEGRLCVRFYRRADGSVLTRNCPVGWQSIKRNVSKMATAFASLAFAALGAVGLTNYLGKPFEQKALNEEIMPQIENSKIEYATADAVVNIKGVSDVKKIPAKATGKVAVKKLNQATVGRIEIIKSVEAGP